MLKKFLNFTLILLVISFFAGLVPEITTAKNDELKVKVFVHYPAPHGRPAPDPCTTTSSDPSTYLLAGWHLGASTGYKVNYGSIPKNIKPVALTALDAAFDTWTAADTDKQFVYSGLTKAQAGKLDFVNTISWKGVSPANAIAVTYIWYYSASGLVADVDTAFNKSYSWSYTAYTTDCGGVIGTFDVQNIATHEFGHWVGLDDLYSLVDKDLTMYGYGDTAELKKDSLGLGDTLGAQVVAP